MIVTDKLSTESFHAFIDEQLTDEQYAQVEAQLDEIPEKIEEIQQCHIINERLREVFDPIVEEPIPDDLFELGLYGLGHEQSGSDDGSYNEGPVSYLELEEDIAAIDSLDIFNEPETSTFVDDTDAADLELLSQTEHLSEFDIDNLRHDPENIIPDIFDHDSDDTENYADLSPGEFDQATDEVDVADPADELLESIDALSEELEKAHENKHTQSHLDETVQAPEADVEPAENLLNEPDASELELQAEDNEYDTDELSLLDESQLLYDEPEANTEPSAQDMVLEKLSSEELTLEPLEEKSNDAFIQELELSGEEETRHFNKQHNKSTRPRNIRADQVVKDNVQVRPPKADEQDSVPVHTRQATSASTHPDTGSRSNANFKQNVVDEDYLPDDLVAEFFAENKGADFEVNEVVKHFGEVSDNFDDDNQLFDEGPLANIKFRTQQFVNELNVRINDFKTSFANKKSELMSRFGGTQEVPDFNDATYGSFSTYKGSSSADALDDTLDLSGFDDLVKEPKPAARRADQNNLESAKAGGRGTPGSNADFQHDFNLDDFALDDVAGSKPSATAEEQDFNARPNTKQRTPARPEQNKTDLFETKPEIANDFNMSFGFEDSADNNNLVNRIGDTLRFYKQKIVEMRAAAVDSENMGEQTASGLEKYKNIALTLAGKLQSANLPKPVIMAALFTGLLLVAGLAAYIGGGAGGDNAEKHIEKLAVDTHLLNSQFNAKITADAESAIIEKLQWFSARIGKQVRLADIRVEDFVFKNVTVIPAMDSFAATNIFENKAGQRITLLAIAETDGVPEVPVSCRIPAEVDGLCSWVKGSVRYIAVANLSLSRVRSFSEQIVENL